MVRWCQWYGSLTHILGELRSLWCCVEHRIKRSSLPLLVGNREDFYNVFGQKFLEVVLPTKSPEGISPKMRSHPRKQMIETNVMYRSAFTLMIVSGV